MPHLLVELGCEELPARWLAQLAKNYVDTFVLLLAQQRVSVVQAQSFSTPRRLAILCELQQDVQIATTVTKRGPTVDIAFDAVGNPTPACIGFMSANGITADQLTEITYKNKQYIAYHTSSPNRPVLELLPDILVLLLKNMHLPVNMRWRMADGVEPEFVRPIRWICCLLDDKAIDSHITVWGLPLLSHSFGHRVYHQGSVTIAHATTYQEDLRKASVIVDATQRRAQIVAKIQALSKARQLTPHIPDTLLDEVTALVEWPHVIIGSFDASYLSLPPEVITTTLTKHQKYFHLLDNQGQLARHFLIVANQTDSDDTIRKGNERVVVPRLEDAKFFVSRDSKIGLPAMAAQLSQVGHVKQLGTLFDKQARMAQLAIWVIAHTNPSVIPAIIERAALLAKADLLSELVGEFPELQGIAGAYYAQDEPQEVRTAIASHYQPLGAQGVLPVDDIGWGLAVAERADTLVGLFAAGILPAGDKDPFALRRAMNALIRLLADSQIEILMIFERTLNAYHEQAIKLQKGADCLIALQIFCFDRLPQVYSQYAAVLPAISAQAPRTISDILQRAKALSNFSTSVYYNDTLQIYKRIHNMLKHADSAVTAVDSVYFTEPIESKLWRALQASCAVTQDYPAQLNELCQLNPIVAGLFDSITIQTSDAVIRNNRLALLQNVKNTYNRVADLRLLPLKKALHQ